MTTYTVRVDEANSPDKVYLFSLVMEAPDAEAALARAVRWARANFPDAEVCTPTLLVYPCECGVPPCEPGTHGYIELSAPEPGDRADAQIARAQSARPHVAIHLDPEAK